MDYSSVPLVERLKSFIVPIDSATPPPNPATSLTIKVDDVIDEEEKEEPPTKRIRRDSPLPATAVGEAPPPPITASSNNNQEKPILIEASFEDVLKALQNEQEKSLQGEKGKDDMEWLKEVKRYRNRYFISKEKGEKEDEDFIGGSLERRLCHNCGKPGHEARDCRIIVVSG